MRMLLIVLPIFSIISYAADKNAAICESLYEKAIYNCEVLMCKESLGSSATESAIEECLHTDVGDLLEGAQICAYDGGEFQSLIDAYNVNHPENIISCEEF